MIEKRFFRLKTFLVGEKTFFGMTLMGVISAGMKEGAIALAVFLRKFTKALDLSGLVCYNGNW